MNATDRLAILRATWTFRICLALAVLEGVQAAITVLEPDIPPALFAALRASLLAAIPVIKFLSITPPPVDLAQKFREAVETPLPDEASDDA